MIKPIGNVMAENEMFLTVKSKALIFSETMKNFLNSDKLVIKLDVERKLLFIKPYDKEKDKQFVYSRKYGNKVGIVSNELFDFLKQYFCYNSIVLGKTFGEGIMFSII